MFRVEWTEAETGRVLWCNIRGKANAVRHASRNRGRVINRAGVVVFGGAR